MALAAAAVLLIASWMLSRAAPRGRRRPGLLGRARAGLLFATVLLGAWMVLGEWHVHRLLSRPRPPTDSLHILHWNAHPLDPSEIAAAIVGQQPDLALIGDWTGRSSFDEVVDALGDGLHLVDLGRSAVFSRDPILRWGTAWLGLEAPPGFPGRPPGGDPGRATFVEIDTTRRLGRPIVVWMLDLPSHPRLHRETVAREAAARIAAWEGWQYLPRRGLPDASEKAGPGFPTPDLILGDFNIPRGSRSLRHLSRGMRDAFHQAGAGYAATYPRHRPLVHIDLTFVRPPLRALGYRIADPGAGRHRMQAVVIGREPPTGRAR